MQERLVILAHGSRRTSWRLPIERLAARLSERLGAAHVAVAYLELCEPDLVAVAAQAVADGVTQLRVLPLFWSGGGHVARDVPPQVDAVRAAHPTLGVIVEPAVGEHPALVDAMVQIAGGG